MLLLTLTNLLDAFQNRLCACVEKAWQARHAGQTGQAREASQAGQAVTQVTSEMNM